MTNNSFFFLRNEAMFLNALFFKRSVLSQPVLQKFSIKANLLLSCPLLKNKKDFRPIKALALFTLFTEKPVTILPNKKKAGSLSSGDFKCTLSKKSVAPFFYFLKFSWFPLMKEKQITYLPAQNDSGFLSFSVDDLHLVAVNYLVYDFFYYRKKLLINICFTKKQEDEAAVYWSFWKINHPFNK